MVAMMKQFSCVVVLYEMSLSESPTVRSLAEQRTLLRERGIHVLVLDNSPGKSPAAFAVNDEIDYVAFGENKGLSNAYQAAFILAKSDNYQFLVLLDQDSLVDSTYILSLDHISTTPATHIGIWCPDVVSCGRHISPYSVNAVGWPDYFPSHGSRRLYGINSFSVIRVECIETLGGFERFYWLDCLDSWLYESAQRRGWAVERLGVTVHHDLSLVSGKISLARMKNIAFYESSFAFEYASMVKVLGALVRLVLRGLKHPRIVGGIWNYFLYLREIYRGGCAGLKRKRAAVASSHRNSI
jgi:hypothetical protein